MSGVTVEELEHRQNDDSLQLQSELVIGRFVDDLHLKSPGIVFEIATNTPLKATNQPAS